MERWMTMAMRHSRIVLIWVAAVTLATALQLPGLQVAVAPQSLSVDGDPDQQFYADTVATFGSDHITVIYVSDPDLFQAEKLAAIRRTIDAVEALPFVDKTRSLFSVPRILVRDDLVTTEPFLAQLPASAEEARRIKTAALQNPFIRKNLLSPDGSALAINVYLKGADHVDGPDGDAGVADAIDAALAQLSDSLAEVYQIGLPYVRSVIAGEAAREQYPILLTGFAVLLLTLALLYRRASALLIPFTTASLSVVWLLGAMAFLGIPLSVLTAVVPVLIVIIGSTEDVHLLAAYYDSASAGDGRLRAVRRMVRRLGLAIGLTFLTSCIGFVAVSANPIGLVREFGIVAASGLAINFVLTALLVPVLLSIHGECDRGSGSPETTGRGLLASQAFTRLILTHRRLVVGLSIGVFGGCVLMSSQLYVDNSLLRFIPSDSPIGGRAQMLHDDLAGIYTFQIIIDGHIDGTFERARYLEEIERLQRYIAQQSPFDHSVSFADYVAVLNSAVNDSGQPELPEDDDVVETLMLFVDPDDVREYLSGNASRASIVVRHGIADSARLHAAIQALEARIAAGVDPDLTVRVTGQSVLASNALTSLALGQIRSLLLVVLAIFVVVSLLFVTAKAGVIAVAVNALSIAALFGAMGLSGIPLDSATAMIAAIAVGIGVDHTMHFMVRYHQHLKAGASEPDALASTIAEEVKPIGTASLALALGFGTLTLSQFPPLYFFGLLSALMMLFSFLSTFVLTPVLLYSVRLTTIWDMIGANVRRRLAQHSPLFHGMRPRQIRQVILLGRVSRFSDGDPIMQRGQRGDALYLLLRGKVCIRSPRPGGDCERVLVDATGEVFGAAALVSGRPRVASATAVGDVELLAIDWTRLQRVARWYPRSAYHLFRNLSVVMGERLAQTAASVGTECRSELRPADQRGRCGRRAHRNPRALAVESALKGAVGDRL